MGRNMSGKLMRLKYDKETKAFCGSRTFSESINTYVPKVKRAT
jgi:hypothetical protein